MCHNDEILDMISVTHVLRCILWTQNMGIYRSVNTLYRHHIDINMMYVPTITNSLQNDIYSILAMSYSYRYYARPVL